MQHKYNANGFCEHCGWRRAFIEETGRPCINPTEEELAEIKQVPATIPENIQAPKESEEVAKAAIKAAAQKTTQALEKSESADISVQTKGNRNQVKTAVALVAIVPLFFVLRGCFVAKGAYHHPGSPQIIFAGAVTQNDSIPAFDGVVSFELKYEPMNERRAFVEIISDEIYNRKKDESYIGGWKDNQGSWGGAILDASVQGNRAIVMVPPDAVAGNEPRKYWVRSALFFGNTFRPADSSLDRILYMLVGVPLDYKSGYYFVSESGGDHMYAASRYHPFWVLSPSTKAKTQLSGTSQTLTNSSVAGMLKTNPPEEKVILLTLTNVVRMAEKMPSLRQVTAGVFTFEVPFDWDITTGALEQQAKGEIEISVQQMLNAYSGTNSSQGFLGIQSFKAVRMPQQAGWFFAYTIRIPPQQDYLATMEKEQGQKLSWGKQQGLVTRVIEHGRQKIGNLEVIKLHSEMSQGARTIAIYYWSVVEPSLVGTINIVVNPSHYSSIKSALDRTLESVRIEPTIK